MYFFCIPSHCDKGAHYSISFTFFMIPNMHSTSFLMLLIFVEKFPSVDATITLECRQIGCSQQRYPLSQTKYIPLSQQTWPCSSQYLHTTLLIQTNRTYFTLQSVLPICLLSIALNWGLYTARIWGLNLMYTEAQGWNIPPYPWHSYGHRLDSSTILHVNVHWTACTWKTNGRIPLWIFVERNDGVRHWKVLLSHIHRDIQETMEELYNLGCGNVSKWVYQMKCITSSQNI